MPTVEVAGAQLDYELTGDSGPLIVQLHGLMSSRAKDAQMGLDLSHALTGHRVLRLDARGHGGSTGTTDPDDYRWESLSTDLLAVLDVLAPGEQVHGVGPSMGTGTLLYAALQDPSRFRSLTLLVPPTSGATRRPQAANYLEGAKLVEREGVDAYVALTADSPSPPALALAPRIGPAVTAELLPTVLRGAAESDLPPRALVETILTPTLILAWSGDPAHPLRTAQRLEKWMPAARLMVARTPYGLTAWPGLFAEHVTTVGVVDPPTAEIRLLR